MNLLQLYEAAKRYAELHEHTITATYVQEYLSDLYSLHLPLILAKKVESAHKAWQESDLSPESYTSLVITVLKDHLLTVD